MADAVANVSALKLRQQAAWATGNYARVGSAIVLVPELLMEAMDVRSSWRVLDVAAGSGNATLAAARRGCTVVSTDFVPALLERGRLRAEAEELDGISFLEADAENLPFADGEFDAAVSTFGVMFTPVQERAAAELWRVVQPGGRIGLACWTPESFVGSMFRVIGGFVPPAPGLKPPALWGTEARLHELFPAAKHIEMQTLHMAFRAPSAAEWLDHFRTFYGPMNRTFAALDEARQAEFRHAVLALADEMNVAEDGEWVVPSEYLQAVITR